MNGALRAYAWLLAALALPSVGCARGSGAVLRENIAIRERANEPDLLLQRARAFAAAADYTRAEQYLTLAIDSGGDERRIAPLLIEVCIKDQRYRAAILHAENHLRKYPRAYRLRFVGATLLAATGEVARAREELEKVLAAEPRYADAHYTIAILLRDSLGNHRQADSHFREYLRLSPTGTHAEEVSESLLQAVP